MSDRASILGAIRSARKAPAQSTEAIAKDAADLVAGPQAIQPDFTEATLLDRFVAKATSERVTATVQQVGALADVPAAVLDYLKRVEHDNSILVQNCPAFDPLDWAAFERSASLKNDGGVAVTLAEYGIAETGSVVFRSAADSPILMNFLPLHHIVILQAARLIGYTEDLWPLLGGADAPQSRVLTLVTGTSGTADIEAKNVRGAHGPEHMHIVIVAS
jgi:L-lactate dehydrogenase complex protein LldG